MNALFGPFAPLLRRLNTPVVGQLIVIPGIILLGAVLRFHLIEYQPLAGDESANLGLAKRPIPDLIAAVQAGSDPPGYALVLGVWRALTGDSPFALRVLSALAGVITIACVYGLGRALFSQGAGMIAALLVAVNSFSVFYGREASTYASLALLVAGAMLAFVHWANRPDDRSRALVVALVNAAGLYVHYTFLAVVAIQWIMFAVWLIPKGAQKTRRWRLVAYLAITGLTIILFAPQIGTAVRQLSLWLNNQQIVASGDGIALAARSLIYGSTLAALPWWTFGWPVLFAVAAILPDWLRRVRSAPPAYWSRLLPWIWIVVTIFPFFALNLFRITNLPLLLPAQIAAALLIGRGIWLLWELGSPNLFLISEALPRFAAAVGLVYMLSVSGEALQNLYETSLYARTDPPGITVRLSVSPINPTSIAE